MTRGICVAALGFVVAVGGSTMLGRSFEIIGEAIEIDLDVAPVDVPILISPRAVTVAQAKDAKKEEPKKTPADEPLQPALDAPPIDPDTLIVTLAEGSKFAGKLSVKEIKVETSFGTLTIPASHIQSLTPGLNSRSELGKKVTALIEQMGSPQYSEREAAEKALLALGEAVRDEVQRHLNDKNPERVKALRKLLEKMDETRAEGDDSQSKSRSWNRLDEVVTPQFKVAGRITPSEFQIISKFGQLTVRLADIQTIERPKSGPTEFSKTVRVEGTQHLIQRGKLNTQVTVQKGDRVTIKAEGSLTMSPWGDEMSSTPDGDGNQYGWYTDGDIPSGALCAMIGTSDKPFKVGSNHTFTAQKAGVLHLAIGMQQGVSGSQFPGGYNVKIRVERQPQPQWSVVGC